MISCEIPRRYRDIAAEFHCQFSGSARSCSLSESARILTTSVSLFVLLHGSARSCSLSESARILTTSVSLFVLLHGGCCRDGSSQPVCSTSSYTAQHFVHLCDHFHNHDIVPSQCYDTSCCEVGDDIVSHDHTIKTVLLKIIR